MARKQKKENPDKIGFGKFMAWQSRGASLGAQTMIIAFITIYCTKTMGMPPALVGTLLLISKVFDGVTDLVAGYIVDRTNTRIGRGRPYELAVLGSWFSIWLLFSMPVEASLSVKGVWLVVAYTLNQSIFATLLNANNTVYMVRAFKKESQYVKLNALGGIVVTLVAVIVNIMLPITIDQMASTPAGWSRMIAYFAIPLGIIGMMRFIFIKEDINASAGITDKVKFKDMLLVLKTNPYIYFVAILLLFYSMISNMGVSIFYFTYIVGDLSMMSICGILSLLVLFSMFLYPVLMKRITARQLIQVGCLVYAVGALLMFFAGSNMTIIVAASIITGIGALPIAYMNGLMVIDCAAFNEWKGRPRMEGTLSSVSGFANKIGAGIGAGLLGMLLSMANFDGNIAVQPDSANMMIRLLFSLIPMMIYLLMAFGLQYYRLDKMMPQISKENEARRKQVDENVVSE